MAVNQEKKTISVEEILNNKDLKLSVIAGKEGIFNEINYSKVQKPGLAIAGFTKYIRKGRVQIIGLSENEYLNSLEEDLQLKLLRAFLEAKPSCIILSKGVKPSSVFIDLANEYEVPILESNYPTSILIEKITNFLTEKLAPSISIHGDLLNIFGIGTLILGESGVGKSEAALELICRGHRLIADDMVIIKKIGENELIGEAPHNIQHYIEIRGIGIINIKEMFGISSTDIHSKIELAISLEKWKEEEEYDRLGIDAHSFNILDVDIPLRKIPVAPGRNIALLIEVAVRDILLKREGINSATQLISAIQNNYKK